MKNFFYSKWPLFLICFFCLIMISIWFREGKFLATGEDGLMLVNPSRALELYRYSWNEVRSGATTPGWISMLPFFYIELLILRIGVPLWLFQATLFFVLMFIGSASIYYLGGQLFGDEQKSNLKKLALIAALFYILNPVSLLGIWYRGIAVSSFIFFYALNPLFFYLYARGLNNGRKIFIIVAPLVALLLSPAFSSPGPPFLLWFLPFLYSLAVAFTRFSNIKVRFQPFPIIYFFATIVFWIAINLWWIFPYIKFSSTAYSSETSPIQAVNTLKANSADFTWDGVVRLIHKGFLYRNEVFGAVYKSPMMLLLSWLIPLVTFYGLLKLRRGQTKSFLILSFVVLLFLAKGTSPPLGGIFLWLFNHVTILQVFRNTFEKFGMLLPAIYAPLFGYGLVYFLSRISNPKIQKGLLTLTVVLLLVYSWPLFTKAIIAFDSRDIRVEVPLSFDQANRLISSKDHIILVVPTMGGGSGFYRWQYGYKGADAAQWLFNNPVINVSYDANSFYGQLLTGLSNGQLDANLVGVAQLFSADIIAYRKDMDISAFGYNFDALERFENMIKSSDLNKIFDSQEVSLWKLPEEKVVPLIYIPRLIKFGNSPEELIFSLNNNQFDPKSDVYICVNQDKCKSSIRLKSADSIQIGAIPDKIEFNKLSPVNYEIKVYNSRGTFILVFNNNYNQGWTVAIGNQQLSRDKHIVANGYANGFIIDGRGDLNISMKFSPEEQIQKSYKVSLFAISLGLIVLAGSIIKNRPRKKYSTYL